jgi:hypothetical protein
MIAVGSIGDVTETDVIAAQTLAQVSLELKGLVPVTPWRMQAASHSILTSWFMLPVPVHGLLFEFQNPQDSGSFQVS